MSPSEAIEEAKAALAPFAKEGADPEWAEFSDNKQIKYATELKLGDLRRASRALAALNEVAVSDDALKYAISLAESLVRKHYPDAPQWRPLDDLMGVLSQIDNMTTGLVRAPAPAETDTLANQETTP